MNLKARIYVTGMVLAGLTVAIQSGAEWQCEDLSRFLSYLLLASLASIFKVNLPSILGTISVNFLFILIAIADLSLGESVAIGCAGTIIQCVWKPKSGVKPIQLMFSSCNTIIAVDLAHRFYRAMVSTNAFLGAPLVLTTSALLFFVMNTAGIALVVSLTEGRAFRKTWFNCYFWSFPFYLVGASIAWIISVVSHYAKWPSGLMLLPVIYVIHRSYRVYLGRLADEKRHVEEMAGLHLRTIEALALAIDAKDHTTHEHLRRVRTYAVDIGKEMKVSESELEALRAAALLHDIGKLAVPEHIISKPGKLSPEEFEKLKIHPTVGAEILERVQFPYPVVPIVRAHHEKWDGTGYPAGLKGDEIPLGARILAVVDCFDALASDRQYRRAMPIDDAMAAVREMAGTSFDPAVVEVLERKYRALDGMADDLPILHGQISRDLQVHSGAPATGFETTLARTPSAPQDFLCSIAAARQEVHLLFELTQDIGTSLSLGETLSVLAVRLRHMVPHDAIAVYVVRNQRLTAEYANGEGARFFSTLNIPVGEGLSGWVAQNRLPMVNGNPSVEAGYLNDPTKFSTHRAGLSVPLEGIDGLVGVLTLYRLEKDSFSRDHLRILLAVAPKIALAMENALKFRQVENSATTDFLTNLPNARSLFLRLQEEVGRCERDGRQLVVLVCDLDGFKQINDHYGHLEGNEMLQRVGFALQANCREYDYVARMGGDEFVVLLPGTDERGVRRRVHELCDAVAEKSRNQRGAGVSLSVGEAIYPRDGVDAEQLLAQADRRMYRVKQLSKTRRARATESQPGELLEIAV